MSQSHYMDKVLIVFIVLTPMDPSLKLMPNSDEV